jgi:hypothetical protein
MRSIKKLSALSHQLSVKAKGEEPWLKAESWELKAASHSYHARVTMAFPEEANWLAHFLCRWKL